MTKDFSYRYRLQLLTDIAITIGEVASTDQHKLVIKIEDHKVEIQGDKSFQLQIDSIAEAIITVSPKELLNKIKTEDLRYINILNQKQYQQIVYGWNKTEADYPKNKTVHQLFEEQVQKTPNNIAVVYEDTKLTYQELNNRANQLAHHLIDSYQIKPDDLVVLCLDRSELMLVVMLGVLKAGGAYVPIDPDHPDERIKYILEDTKAKVVLTDNSHKEKIEQVSQGGQESKSSIDINDTEIGNVETNNVTAIDVVVVTNEELSKFKNSNPTTAVTSNNLIYVFYTSGTTGNPKGVMVEHKSVVNTVLSLYDVYDFSKGNKTTAFTSYAFDVSASEFFIALLGEAELHLFSEEVKKDALLLSDYVKDKKINYLYLPPAMLTVLPKVNYKTLKAIVYAGEPCDKETGKYWSGKYPLYNYYGPTEATIYATGKQIIAGDTHLIGSPISNAKCYILDENLLPLPVGAVGELYIGGAGIARGYLNRPDLDTRFISNPFQIQEEKKPNKNSKLYKTGDLVRWLSDGNIEYIGRNDFQVKIRGHRVELEEIENSLFAYKPIKQAVVLVKGLLRKDVENKYLVGYYVADNMLDEEDILSYLRSKLPGYMVPSKMICLKSMPLTSSGKVDRSVLQAPELLNENNYVPPRNRLEKLICQIWANLLSLPENKVGIKDDYFRLGGDSIIAILLVSKLRQDIGVETSVKEIFNNRTVEKFYNNVVDKVQDNSWQDLKSEQGRLSGEVPLLPIQKWFFKCNFPVATHWNQSFLVKTPRLDSERLQVSIAKLESYHDALRLRYKAGDDFDRTQYYDKNAKPEELKLLDINTLKNKEGSSGFYLELENIFTNWQSGFNLENGPMYSIGYVYGYHDNSARIHFASHYLLMDAVSWGIIVKDLQRVYNHKKLDIKGTSYRHWADVVNQYAQTRSEEKSYWLKVLHDYNPNQFNQLIESENARNCIDFEFDSEQTRLLLGKCNDAYHTEVNDLMLTAFGRALFLLTNNEVHHITLEGYGREEIDEGIDITRTVGCFTTVYPVRLESTGDLRESLVVTKETLRKIPNKGIGYGVLVGSENNILPKVGFNYLSQFGKEAAGNITTLKNKANAWAIIGENRGRASYNANQGYNIIDVNGWVVGNKLKFNILSKLDKKAIAKLAELFKRNLEEIINHCVHKANVEYTASDFAHITSEGDLLDLPLVVGSNQYDWFEMSEMQKAYLLGMLKYYEIGNVANHIYSENYYKYIDVNKLENAINVLLEKCPVLRTVYSLGKLQQRFLPLHEIPKYQIQVNDCSQRFFNENDLVLIKNRLSHKSYDCSKFPLFTFEITKFKDVQVLHSSVEVILLDVQSRRMFFNFIDKVYRCPDFEIKLPAVTFRDYQEYCKLLKHSSWYQNDKAYWEEKIVNMPLRPELPFNISPEKIDKPWFNEHTLYVEEEVWSKFKEKARKYNISYASALLALFGKIIAYFSGDKEFLITVTLFNRYAVYNEANNVLGDFTSASLFHYIDFGDNLFKELKRTHDVIWEDVHHLLYCGLEVQRDIIKYNQLNGDKAASPIVFTAIIDDERESAFLEDSEFLGKRYSFGQTSQAWIDLQALEVNNRFKSQWLYVSQLFDESYIAELNNLYCRLITYLAEHDWEDIVNLSYLPKQDRGLIAQSNSDVQELSDDTLFGRYERVIREGALQNRCAVIEGGGGKSYNYDQLLEESDLFARYIFEIKSDSNKCSCQKTEQPSESEDILIGVLGEKGYNQVLATLAIMKAGFAYLPLNVDWPTARIESILDQAGASTLLISRDAYFKFGCKLASKYRLIVIDEGLRLFSSDKSKWRGLLKIKLPNVKADDIAYVVFTSGSTGSPKGVTISHRNALNTIDAINNKFKITKQDAAFAISELSFDLSVYDIFGILAVGGKIVFPAQCKAKEPKHWLELIKRNQVTIWNSVPQLADLLIDERAKFRDTNISCLRLFLLSGDWVPINLPDKIKKYCQQAQVTSLGGATEGSIWSIWYDIDKVNKDWNSIPYGIAMPNQKMYVLNHNREHCPVGVEGDIYIGGLGVALNYWRDEERTNASFIDSDKLGRLYRTGDLGRWNLNGYIEFLGRKDNQVKVRGYRIELGEIEHQLSQVPGVKQAIANIIFDNNERKIIAYVVPERDDAVLRGNNSNIILGYEARLKFKLTQPGVRQVTRDEETIELLKPAKSLIEQDCFKRKSYRTYNEEALSIDLVKKMLDSSVRQGSYVLKFVNFDLPTLSRMLLPLMGHVYEENPLPKYCYPSAGSLYPVQVYLKANIGKNKVGFFYYDRIEHKLRLIAYSPNSTESLLPQIYLVAKYSAIKPLYTALAKEFCLLEAGYIHGLLNLDGEQFGIEWANSNLPVATTDNLNLEADSEVIACLTPGQQNKGRQELLKTYLYVKPGRVDGLAGGWYKHVDATFHKVSDDVLSENPVLNDNDSIWYDSAFGIFYVNEDLGGIEEEQLLEAGFKAQIDMEEGIKNKIGLCAMGDISNILQETVRKISRRNTIVHFLLGGEVTDDQVNEKGISNARVGDASKQQINSRLSKQLPDYMVPNYIILLDQIPLAANGKIDMKALPKLGEDLKPNKGLYVAPTNELESKICNAYEGILHLPTKTIGISADFFKMGGDSVSAIRLTSGLQQFLKISLVDLFRLKTPAKIAQQIPETSIILDLPRKLQKVVHLYQNRKPSKDDLVVARFKRDKYLQEVKELKFEPQLKDITNVLLTGATGFLGCNLLYQLLTTTDYKVCLLVRGDSEEHGYNRVSNKFNFYFDARLNDYKDRITVLKANLEQLNLGLKTNQYYDLVESVDSIIHPAALVKYYGDYDIFYQSNVQATVNLLELAKLTAKKDFHYISTNYIFMDGYVPNCSYYVFDESDTQELLVGNDNFYYKTKHEAEVAVCNYRKHGVTSNIYRVGNLTAHSTNYRNQENIEDNGFVHCVKTQIALGAVLEEDYMAFEMSPVDCVALAIVKIFNQTQLTNQAHHVFSSKPANLHELLSAYDNICLQKLTIDKFAEVMLEKADHSSYRELIDLFMLHQWWVQHIKYPYLTKTEILQNKTDVVLKKLGFAWPEINHKMLSEIVKTVVPIV